MAEDLSLEIGATAPDFTLNADGDQTITLSDIQQHVVLYFYPKDDTPGCTVEAKDFRDHIEAFKEANTVIIGISKDSVASHDKFKTKHCLPFTLVSDEDGSTCEAYGTWVEKNMYGKKYMGIQRDTFLIKNDGTIAHIWRKVKVNGHVDDVLSKVKELES